MIDDKLLAPVRRGITVPLAAQAAFDLFTAGLDRWWIRQYQIGRTPMRSAILEPRAGGRWYEIGEDGVESDWGRVLVWDPPHRLVLTWQITAEWAYDPTLITEVEVTFTEAGEGATDVSVEHRNLEAYGGSATDMRLTFGGPNGWVGLLTRYAATAAQVK